ncbi:MAG: type IV pili twitching motility protein PilT, partial [Patescibacteria group bacterium]|nr:type IV pili twitching motility protein PilT [Patescibacteria group bacterium]
AIYNLIRQHKLAHITSAMQTSRSEGMITMGLAIKRLYEEGLIEEHTYKNRINNGETLNTYY